MYRAIRLHSANVGQPGVIGQIHDKDVISCINKRPVETDFIELTPEGITGDQQSDKRPYKGAQMHGGRDKAVLVMPAEHYGHWIESIGRPLDVLSFGENLTVSDVIEDEVRVGDVWSWDYALLRVTKPRTPCQTLVMHLGVPDAVKRMADHGGCGWYMEVIRPAQVRVKGHFGGQISLLKAAPSDSPTIAEIFAEKMSRKMASPVSE